MEKNEGARQVTRDDIEQALTRGTDNTEIREAAVRAVAEDVIVQLLSRRYVGTHGDYFTAKSEKTCTVCAIGSAIVSEHSLSSGLKNFKMVEKSLSPSKYIDYMYRCDYNSVFGTCQLEELERVFEQEMKVYVEMAGGTYETFRYNRGDDGIYDRKNHGDQALLVMFAEILLAGGDVDWAIDRLRHYGPNVHGGSRVQQVMSVIEGVAKKHGLEIREGSKACEVLSELKTAKIMVSKNS